jgi:hypothetical protein
LDAVEQALRGHVRAAKGVRAFHYRMLSGAERYWPDAASMSTIQRLDRAGECQRVAVEASERHGLGIAVGWCLDFDGRACWHCCNVTSSAKLIDAGRDRHQKGFVGKVLTEREAAMLGRAAQQPSLSELGERGGSLLGALLG